MNARGDHERATGPNPRGKTSAMKRLLSTAALLLASAAGSSTALAGESAFLYPQLGLGTGPAWIDGAASRSVSCDFVFGNDWELAGPLATGFTAGFELEGAQPQVLGDWWRFSLTSMWTGSLGYWDPLPFLRLGAGPSLAVTKIASRPHVQVGLGLTAEAAAGFRSVAELYVQASTVADPAGLATSATVGFRLNVWVVDLLFGGGGWHGPGYGGGHGGHPARIHDSPSPHRAVPAG